ncbi:MaoC/PaaZ C-terminal domain-containing protein [Tessaracoccus terricola]
MAADELTRLHELPGLGGLFAKALATGFNRPGPEAGLPSRSVVVETLAQDPERLAAYNRVTGFGMRSTVPATWLHVQTFPLHAWLMAQSDFPFPLAGTVHVSNEMTLHRPVAVGDKLWVRVTCNNLAPHKRGVTFDLVGEIRVGSDIVWTGTSTYLALGKKLAGAPRSAPRLEGPDFPASQLWRLPADLGRQYAKVSGDTNPIHLSKLTAMPFGFKRAIIHGMWTHAKALSSLGPRLPETHTVKVAFTKPISLPGRVRFAADDEFRFAVVNSDESKTYLVGQVLPD